MSLFNSQLAESLRSSTSNPFEYGNSLKQESPIVSLSVKNGSQEVKVKDLDEKIQFRLPVKENKAYKCSYFNKVQSLWSREGCSYNSTVVDEKNQAWALCDCDHLTDFSADSGVGSGSNALGSNNAASLTKIENLSKIAYYVTEPFYFSVLFSIFTFQYLYVYPSPLGISL